MIFSKRINKLSSGKNISFYPKSLDLVEMFVFNKDVSKKLLYFGDLGLIKCLNSNQKYPYHKLIKLKGNFSAVCLDKNISIVECVE